MERKFECRRKKTEKGGKPAWQLQLEFNWHKAFGREPFKISYDERPGGLYPTPVQGGSA
jgi:hypothetical protein